MRCSSVMTAREPPERTKRSAASTLGPIEPEANSPCAAYASSSAGVTDAEGALLRRAPADGDVLDVGRDDERVGLDGRREQGRREVLVDDGLDAVQVAVGLPHDGNAAPTGRDDDVAGSEQRQHGRRLEHLERLG